MVVKPGSQGWSAQANGSLSPEEQDLYRPQRFRHPVGCPTRGKRRVGEYIRVHVRSGDG